MSLSSSMFLAKGSFEPSDRIYNDDHIVAMGDTPLEIPSDRNIIRVTSTSEINISWVVPGRNRQRIIIENANGGVSPAPINLKQRSDTHGNIELGLDPDDITNRTRTLYSDGNIELWFDKDRNAWVGNTVPAAINGGTFV
jgi:hypothetical protein